MDQDTNSLADNCNLTFFIPSMFLEPSLAPRLNRLSHPVLVTNLLPSY